MSTGSRPPKRPAVGSRTPTGRPRKVAGRRDLPAEEPTVEEPAVDEPADVEAPAEVPVAEPADEPVEDAPPVDAESEPTADADEGEPSRGRLLATRRTTVALVVALVVLVGVLVAQIWYVAVEDGPTPSADRPVVTGEIAHRAAVDAAAQAAQDAFTYKYEDFDAEIEAATSKMTKPFAQQYRDTAAGVRKEFVEDKTEQEVKVVGQSVVQASSQQIQALLFLDQYVTKNGHGTDVTPFRALVTMEHVDNQWLVSDIKTE